MKPLWSGLTRTEHDLLKYLSKKEAALRTKYDRMKQTIENRHLADEAHLEATVGAELTNVQARIAELEAKKAVDL